MKLKLLLAVIGSSTLLLGCSTSRPAEHWEYKTFNLPSYDKSVIEAKLNELGGEGWALVGFSRNEGGSNQSTFVMKRASETGAQSSIVGSSSHVMRYITKTVIASTAIAAVAHNAAY